MKLICVCKYCDWYEKENPVIEFNFKEEVVYFYCPNCKKEGRSGLNKMSITSHVKPLPKSRRIGM